MRDTAQGEDLLKYLAWSARHNFGLTVWQWSTPGNRLPRSGHASGSYHYQEFSDGYGMAWDAYGSLWRMGKFAAACQKHHASHLTELIHNSAFPRMNGSVKHGRVEPYSYWGQTTWRNHRNHVHCAVKPGTP